MGNKTSPIIGHTEQVAQLMLDREAHNVAHAYLFAGPRHLGKMTVAKWFAAQLLSAGQDEETRRDTERRCRNLIHTDLFVLDRLWQEGVCENRDTIAQFSNVAQKHRKDSKIKTDTIVVDDIRALRDRLYETGERQYRVSIIRSVERMHPAAVNALLKILEEPPPGRVFLLTTQTLSSLLPTVISRSRVLRFSPVSDEQISPLLSNKTAQERALILTIAQNAPGTVKTLCEDPEKLKQEQDLFEQAVRFWKTSSRQNRLDLLRPLYERNEQAEHFLFHLALALRKLAVLTPKTFSAYEAVFRRFAHAREVNVNAQLLAQDFVLQLEAIPELAKIGK